MVLKRLRRATCLFYRFENDVKMYGTETVDIDGHQVVPFENDVKMYGTETSLFRFFEVGQFENDVKMYGTETH